MGSASVSENLVQVTKTPVKKWKKQKYWNSKDYDFRRLNVTKHNELKNFSFYSSSIFICKVIQNFCWVSKY